MSTRKRPAKGASPAPKSGTASRPISNTTPRPAAAMRPTTGAAKTAVPAASANDTTPPKKAPAAPSMQTAAQKPAAQANGVARRGTASAAAVVAPARPSWFSAVIRAFPYIGVAYIIFLAAIENGPQTAVVVGVIALIVGIVLFVPRFTRAFDTITAFVNLRRTIDQWAGEPLNVAASLVSLGLALVFWVRWHATGDGFFSLVSIMFLVVALAWLIRASYLRQEA